MTVLVHGLKQMRDGGSEAADETDAKLSMKQMKTLIMQKGLHSTRHFPQAR